MKLFLGEFVQNVVGTRIAVPKKIREQIKSRNFVLAKGFERCLFGYATEKWEEVSASQTNSSLSDIKARDLKRYLYSGSHELEFDGQGRIVVPETLRQYAGIKDEVTVIGAGDHFEIWDTRIWRSHLTALEATLPNG